MTGHRTDNDNNQHKEGPVMTATLGSESTVREEEEDRRLQGIEEAKTELSLLSQADLKSLQGLHAEYKRAMEETQIATIAKYRSIRQTAFAAVASMLVLMTIGTAIVKIKSNISAAQATLFSVYTVTSAGLGNVAIPHTNAFFVFVVVYVFLGISCLAILVAQTYQYLELEAKRRQHTRDKEDSARVGMHQLHKLITRAKRTGVNDTPSGSFEPPPLSTVDYQIRRSLYRVLKSVPQPHSCLRDWFLCCCCDCRQFKCLFLQSEWVSVCIVPAFLILLLAIGTIGMITLEDRTFVEAFYFSANALMTIGYGDIYPTTNGGTWFVACWLPFAVLFLALYLGTVAHYYVQFSNLNVSRLERRLKEGYYQRQLQQDGSKSPSTGAAAGAAAMAKAKAEAAAKKETKSPLKTTKNKLDRKRVYSGKKNGVVVINMQARRNQRSDMSGIHSTGILPKHPPILSDGDDATRDHDEFHDDSQGAVDDGFNIDKVFEEQEAQDLIIPRRQRIRTKSRLAFEDVSTVDGSREEQVVTISSARDLLLVMGLLDGSKTSTGTTTNSNNNFRREPSFARLIANNPVAKQLLENADSKLRFRVLERVARIIAFEMASMEHSRMIEVEGNFFWLRVNELKLIADKWFVPRKARDAFREVSFESLVFVGERELILRGMDSFLDLNPFEFNHLFSPFAAALENSETMQGWLASTDVLIGHITVAAAAGAAKSSTSILMDRRRSGSRFLFNNPIESYFPRNEGNAILVRRAEKNF